MQEGYSDKLNSWDVTLNGLLEKGLIYNYLNPSGNQWYSLTGTGVTAYRNGFKGLKLNQDEKAAIAYLYRMAFPKNEEE